MAGDDPDDVEPYDVERLDLPENDGRRQVDAQRHTPSGNLALGEGERDADRGRRGQGAVSWVRRIRGGPVDAQEEEHGDSRGRNASPCH